jgi:hypothetical protein
MGKGQDADEAHDQEHPDREELSLRREDPLLDPAEDAIRRVEDTRKKHGG